MENRQNQREHAHDDATNGPVEEAWDVYSEEHEDIDASEAIGGEYLSKDDLDGPVTLRIAGAKWETIPRSGKRKLVVRFADRNKRLVLNTTNNRRLMKMFGKFTSGWVGKKVRLYVDPNAEFSGEVVGGIRVAAAQGDANLDASKTPSDPLA